MPASPSRPPDAPDFPSFPTGARPDAHTVEYASRSRHRCSSVRRIGKIRTVPEAAVAARLVRRLLFSRTEMRRGRVAAGLMGAAAGAAGVQVWARFVADLRAQRARVARGSRVWPSPRFGPIEYAMFGRGVPVLLAHGAGGGFDQVAPAAERLAAAGYQVVAPSRFGYLRSSIPDDPTPHNQAEAFVALLDQLQLRQASVVGISAGALSALQLVLAYPERCRSLVLLVPAAAAAIGAMGVLPLRSPILMALAARVVRSDFLYWLALEIAPDAMTRSLLATDPAIVAAADPIERRRAWDLLWNVLPVSARAQGLLNDAHFVATPQPVPLDRIQTPTLVISLEDDRYRTIEPARSIAEAIPGARLLTYPSGGHVWVGHDAELMAEITAFLRDR